MTAEIVTAEMYRKFSSFIAEYVLRKSVYKHLPDPVDPVPKFCQEYVGYKFGEIPDFVVSRSYPGEIERAAPPITPTTFYLGVVPGKVELGKDMIQFGKWNLMQGYLGGVASQITHQLNKLVFTGNVKCATSSYMGSATEEAIADATVTTYGDVITAVNEMFAAMNSAYLDRDTGILLFMTWGVYRQLQANRSGAGEDTNEYFALLRDFGPDGSRPYYIKDIIITDYLYDGTPSNTAQYMMMVIPDGRWNAKLISEEASMYTFDKGSVIEVQLISRGCGAIFDSASVFKTDMLTTTGA